MSILSPFIMSYVIIGVEYVCASLHASALNRPVWAVRPSVVKVLLAWLLWPFFQILGGVSLRAAAAMTVIDYLLFTLLLWLIDLVCYALFSGSFIAWSIIFLIALLPMRWVRMLISVFVLHTALILSAKRK